MREEVLTSPLAYGGGAWYTKQAARRVLLSLPYSIIPTLFAIHYCANNPTCPAGDIAGFSGSLGIGAGIFLSSYKWLGSPKRPFISVNLVKLSLKLVLVAVLFASAFLITKDSLLVFGAAASYGFTIWFIYGAFSFWVLNKLIYRNKKSEI